MKLEVALKKSHFKLMRHAETRAMCGIFVSGKTEIVEDGSIPTACTDGWNKYYSRAFCESKTLEEVTGIVLHENYHVYLKHIPRFRKLMKQDAKTANAAMDYAINGLIHSIKDKTLCTLPEPHLYDPKFKDWSVQEIYDFLRSGRNKDGKQEGKPQQSQDGSSVNVGGREYKLDTLDDHTEPADSVTPKELKEIETKVQNAIQQGAIIAGAMGLDLPRAIKELLKPDVDWVEEFSQFLSNSIKGSEEYTFRKYNRRYLADDIYFPTRYQETVGNVVLAIDTSGSISNETLSVWAGAVAAICESVVPDQVRVIWWDSKVRAEQLFTPGDYGSIRNILKPKGGGGTCVSSVAEHIERQGIEAECVVVLTDGYVEHQPRWGINIPTLWMVTENKHFTPPKGRVVSVNI